MPPTTDELAAKYDSSAKSPPPGSDDLAKKYDVGQSSATTADNEVERSVQKKPEGLLHSAATALGINPEAAWEGIKHPIDTAQNFLSASGEQMLHPINSGLVGQTGRSLAAAVGYNPGATQQALQRLHQPGALNKIEGGIEYLSSGVPLVGGNLVKAEEQAGQGNTMGSVGTVLGTAAPMLLDPGVRGGAVETLEPVANPVTMTRNAIGDVIHDPTTGEMKPIATKLAKVGGGAVGGWIGYGTHLPEMGPLGAYGGVTIGPAAAEWAFPESSARANARSAPPEELKGNPTPFEPAAEPPAPGLQHIGVRPIGQPDVAPAPIERVRPFTANDAGKLSKQMMDVKEPPDPLKEKYPDTRTRQMVHANGEEIVKAIGDDKALMNELHSLKNADVGVAASKLGYDMGQRSVTSSKFEGEKGVGRQQVLDELIRAGHTPREIIKASKPTPAAHRE